jgi:hypothetical protein
MTALQFDDFNLLPDKENEKVLRTISALGIDYKPIYVDIIPDKYAINGDCFLNVLNKVNIENGETIFGWKFVEYSYMIEAQFHAVWKTPFGNFVDITPGDDPNEKCILFVIDRTRTFEGKRIDNFRFNTTNNLLVDDIIEIEIAKFKLINKVEQVDATGRVIFKKDEALKWDHLNRISIIIDEMYRCDQTVHSRCFCNLDLSYEQCHRRKIYEFLATFEGKE